MRTTALLFVLRGLLKGQDAHNGEDKDKALKACAEMPRGARKPSPRICTTDRTWRARC